MTELAFLSIAEASRLIAARKLSPVELTEACLRRIAAFDSQLDSFVTLTADRARAEAKAAEAAIMACGPVSRLHGIPYCLKDIFDTAGIRTTAMSKLLADNVPTRDARCQEKLAAAGGVLLGKNATWEFAHGGPSWDVLFPPARNPWNRSCSPAGSSSGSGRRHRGGLRAGDAGQRYRRLDPRAGRGLWNRRPEADLWPGQPSRRHSELFQPRPRGPAGLDDRGCGDPAADHRRP